jgi:anti-sigma B factor antagonist
MTPFSVERTGAGTVSIRGEVDGAAVAALEAACAEAGDQVRIDCSGCEFIDSAGVSALLRLRAERVERGGSLTLVDPSPVVVRVLEITGLAEAFGVAT